jgi:hypothetical protein
MLRRLSAALAAVSLVVPAAVQAASFADAVIAYSPGTGYAVDPSTGQGYTNAAAALGEPSRVTPGAFGGPVDPFNPPYLNSQMVSIGTGGSLTLELSSPIANDPAHPFGIDFIIYGHTGFVITNGNYSGGGVTDGSLFGANSGTSRIAVSADDKTFYQLDPARAPVVDGLFPTDGSGSFDVPVNPALTGASFAGLDLAGIRGLYNGSAGGTGFDLAWAQDAQGNPVTLPDVRFIRVDVLSGVAEVDGVSGLGAVPEPASGALLAMGFGAVLCWRRELGRRAKRC